MNIKINKAPTPVGAYPHSKKVGNFLFLSGVGPRKGDLKEIPDNIKHDLIIKPVKWIDEVIDLSLQFAPQPLAIESTGAGKKAVVKDDSEPLNTH